MWIMITLAAAAVIGQWCWEENNKKLVSERCRAQAKMLKLKELENKAMLSQTEVLGKQIEVLQGEVTRLHALLVATQTHTFTPQTKARAN